MDPSDNMSSSLSSNQTVVRCPVEMTGSSRTSEKELFDLQTFNLTQLNRKSLIVLN